MNLKIIRYGIGRKYNDFRSRIERIKRGDLVTILSKQL